MITSKRFCLLFLSIVVLSISLHSQDISATKDHKIVFSTNWYPQSQFAGYYVALEKGFYKNAGLDVSIIHPSINRSPIDNLNTHKSDITIMPLHQAMWAYNCDNPFVNILQTSQNSPLVVITRSNITSLKQLNDKSVGLWKSGASDIVASMLEDQHIFPNYVFFTSGINLFLSQAVDAIVTMDFNEYFMLMNSGLDSTDINCFALKDNNFNVVSDGLYCLKSTADSCKEDISAFAKASIEGWEYARNHKDETLQIVYKYMRINNIAINYANQSWMLDKYISGIKDSDTGEYTYSLHSDDFDFLKNILQRDKFWNVSVDYKSFVFNNDEK